MQWKWKAWLHTPQVTVHSSLLFETWFAWHSMPRSDKSVNLNTISKVIVPMGKEELTWVHDVVSANGTVINVDVYTEREGVSTEEEPYPKPRGLLHSTF